MPIHLKFSVDLIPLLQIVLSQELEPVCSTKIGGGHRLDDVHIIQCVHVKYVGIATQSHSDVALTQIVYCGANGTRDSLREKIDAKVRQTAGKINIQDLTSTRSKPV